MGSDPFMPLMATGAAGAAVGGTFGTVMGAVVGTRHAILYKSPGVSKIKFIGRTTLYSAAIFGLLGCGSFIYNMN